MRVPRWSTVSVCAVVLTLVTLVGACAAPAPGPAAKSPTAPVPSAAATFKWPATLTIVTSGLGTEGYISTAAWAPVMEQKTGTKVRTTPEDDRAVQHRYLRTDEADIAGITSTDFGNVIEALDVHASRDGGPYQFGTVWINSPVVNGFLVRKDSDIKTIYDIKAGMKIAYYATPGGRNTMDALLAWIGLQRKDIKVVEFSTFADNGKSIMDERTDVSYTSLASPAAYEIAAGSHGVRVLELPVDKDPAGAARFLEVRPLSTFAPATTATIKEGLGVMTFHSPIPYLARAEKNPDLVYNIAKWLGENHDSYKDKHEILQGYSLNAFMPSIINRAFVPIHEGTIKYLKEKGVWTPALDARQKYNVDLLTRYINAYKAAVAKADAQGITISPREKKWTDMWDAYKKELGLPRVKVMLDIPK